MNQIIGPYSDSVNRGPHHCLTPASPVVANTPTKICRICHEIEERARHLFSPCRCSGTMALVHQDCLERWLTSSDATKCEVCQHTYQIAKEGRSIKEWFNSPSHPNDVKNLLGDTVCFILLTPLAGISCYMCIQGILSFMVWRLQAQLVGLIILCICLVFVYSTWTIITIRYHIKVWLAWKKTNQTVKLLRLTKSPSPESTGITPSGEQSPSSVIIVNTPLRVTRFDPEGGESENRNSENGVPEVEVLPRSTNQVQQILETAV